MFPYLHLGASLYVPATQPDLLNIVMGEKYPFLRSVIICTEDAIADHELPAALDNLEQCLKVLEHQALLRFIRVRNPEILARLLKFTGIDRIEGFVLPKVSAVNWPEYMSLLAGHPRFWLMPTLETREIFDNTQIEELRHQFLVPAALRRILAVRIGGNDLLGTMGICTAHGIEPCHETMLSLMISRLIMLFRPFGLPLSAPVANGWHSSEELRREVKRDVQLGMLTKSVIHPLQVQQIHEGYRVEAREHEVAQMLLCREKPNVIGFDGAMWEKGPHHQWAVLTVMRAQIYGIRDEASITSMPTLQSNVRRRIN